MLRVFCIVPGLKNGSASKDFFPSLVTSIFAKRGGHPDKFSDIKVKFLCIKRVLISGKGEAADLYFSR